MTLHFPLGPTPVILLAPAYPWEASAGPRAPGGALADAQRSREPLGSCANTWDVIDLGCYRTSKLGVGGQSWEPPEIPPGVRVGRRKLVSIDLEIPRVHLQPPPSLPRLLSSSSVSSAPGVSFSLSLWLKLSTASPFPHESYF